MRERLALRRLKRWVNRKPNSVIRVKRAEKKEAQ
jgi:hypothetical protein